MAPMVRSSGAWVVYSTWIREPMEKSPASRVRASGCWARSRSRAVISRAYPPVSPPSPSLWGRKWECRSWVKSTVVV